MDQIFVQAAKYGSPGKMKSHIHLDGEKGLSNILPLFFYAVIINRYYGSMSMCSWEETSLLEHLSLFSDLICVHKEAGTYTAISELTVWGKAIGKGDKAFWFRLSRGIQIRKRWVLFFHIFGLCSSHSGVLQRNRLWIHAPGSCCTVSMGTSEILWAASFLVSVSSLRTDSIRYSWRINFWGVFENRAY